MKKSILSKNIKKLRTLKGLNQTEFAELFNITRSSIGAYEEGRAEPKLETLIQFSNYFKLSIDDIVKKDLTVNQITKFDAQFNKYSYPSELQKLEKEVKKLNQNYADLASKIDTLLQRD